MKKPRLRWKAAIGIFWTQFSSWRLKAKSRTPLQAPILLQTKLPHPKRLTYLRK